MAEVTGQENDVVAHVAVTIDGYVADADGGVDYLEKYSLDDFDFEAWADKIGALIMGRTTYEQTIGWGWVWGDRPTMVLTTKGELEVPEGANVEFAATPTADAIRSFAARTPKRLWVFGGGKVITDALLGGAVDTLDLMVMPEALGSGIPLFTEGCAPPMTVAETTAYGNGALRVVYDVSGPTDAQP